MIESFVVVVRFFSGAISFYARREVPRINYIGNDISTGNLGDSQRRKGSLNRVYDGEKKAIIDSRVSRDLYDLRGSLRKRQITWRGGSRTVLQRSNGQSCVAWIPFETERKRERVRDVKSFKFVLSRETCSLERSYTQGFTCNGANIASPFDSPRPYTFLCFYLLPTSRDNVLIRLDLRETRPCLLVLDPIPSTKSDVAFQPLVNRFERISSTSHFFD